MRALLNSLGLSLWWATAIILAAGVALVGYRVSLGLKVPMLSLPSATPALEPLVPQGSAAASAAQGGAQARRPTSLPIGPMSGRSSSTSARPAAQSRAGQAARDDLTAAEQPQGITDFERKTMLKDCKSAVAAADRAIASEKKQGDTPKEHLYRFKLQCASDAGDQTAMDGVLVDLVRLTNSTQYWNPLLRIERQKERDDHNTLMIYRIMYNTSSMNQDTDYIEMAQLLGDAALPGEAAAVLNKAMSGGLIKDEHKERTERLLKSLQNRADADREGLPQQEAEADKSANGELEVKLGEIYYGLGDYQRAADAIIDGITRGGVRRLDEAYVYLGLAQARLDDTVGARDAFAMLDHVPDVSPRVLRLWRLYAAHPENVSRADALAPASGMTGVAERRLLRPADRAG